MRTQPFLLAIPSKFRTKKTWSVKMNFLFGGKDRDRERGKWETTKIMRGKGCKHVDKIIKYFIVLQRISRTFEQRCHFSPTLPLFTALPLFIYITSLYPTAFSCANIITCLIISKGISTVCKVAIFQQRCHFSPTVALFSPFPKTPCL